MSCKPNIVLVMTDQQRHDRLGCMGDPLLNTPNMDSVAAEGVRFTNAYAASPVCAPSRAALKSGRYPPGCGVVGNWVPFHERAPELLTHRLRAVGYQTAMVGKLHFVPAEDTYGFDWKALHDAPYSVYAWDDRHSEYIRWLRENAYRARDVDPVAQFDEDENAFKRDDWYRFTMGSGFRSEEEHDIPWTVAQAERYLDERDRERPFFLYLSFFGPHQPFEAPAPWNRLYDPREITLPPQFDADMRDCPVFQATCAARAAKFRASWDRGTYQRMLAAYYGQIAMIDHYLGKLFRRLRREGLWDDSLVVFASDHGDHNGAYGLFFKGEMYDSCAKVPLLIKPPRQALGASVTGAVREEVVNLLDLYGTLLEAAGDTCWRGPEIEARSLWPLAVGADVAWDNQTYAIIGERADANLTMLRRDHLKLIRKARPGADPLHELYDMNDVVTDVRNRAGEARYAEARAALVAQLDGWCREQAARYPHQIDHRYRRSD